MSRSSSKQQRVVSPTGHKIALYVRVSTEEAANNPEGSIKSQEQRLRQHVEYRNAMEPFGTIVGLYIDRAKSGKDTNRPELQKMLSAIRRGEISHVLVTELSRLSRNIRDFLEMWEMMEGVGCQFQSLREQVDTSTAAGRMVINSMMNFAQFEREQTAERVIANLIARSARGLYNGGIVPLGYKTIPEKNGYLAIDEAAAPVIREVFEVFLREESLTRTAKWLNANGRRVPQKMSNGGGKPRLGHFTFENLQFILRNKAYAGIKVHRVNGEDKEAKAVWEQIVDPITFNRAQKLLDQNYRRKKPLTQVNRFPFQLAGLVYCATCGDRLSGKSAHGNGGKIPYYEHAWATKRQACLVKKVFDCKPNRVLAKKLEPLVWGKVEELLRQSQFAQGLVAEAQASFEKNTRGDELKKVRDHLAALDGQMEALAERIASLPKAIPAEPFYKQMEKIQARRKEDEARLGQLENDPAYQEVPTSLPAYEAFLTVLRGFADDPIILENRIKIIGRLIHKVEIRPGSFRLHFNIGRNYIEGELAKAGSLFSCPQGGQDGKRKRAEQPFSRSAPSFSKPSAYFGSNTLTNGWGTRIRT